MGAELRRANLRDVADHIQRFTKTGGPVWEARFDKNFELDVLKNGVVLCHVAIDKSFVCSDPTEVRLVVSSPFDPNYIIRPIAKSFVERIPWWPTDWGKPPVKTEPPPVVPLPSPRTDLAYRTWEWLKASAKVWVNRWLELHW
jgi:hypothetical protein